jgi:branched-chain amino acid transport system ATP-binding protein
VLDLSNVEVVYNDVILVLRGLSIDVPDGQIVALLGANGAGKTTTLRTITGLLDNHEGQITKGKVIFDGKDINAQARSDIVAGRHHPGDGGPAGLRELTVDENLQCGGITKDKGSTRPYERVMDLFPRLAGAAQAGRRLPVRRRAADARHRPGAHEPNRSCSSSTSRHWAWPQARRADPRHHRRHQQVQGTSVLLIEQNAMMALSIADYGYVMEQGKVVMDGTGEKLLADDDVKEFYLGLHGDDGDEALVPGRQALQATQEVVVVSGTSDRGVASDRTWPRHPRSPAAKRPPDPLLEVDDIVLRFGGVTAIDGVSFTSTRRAVRDHRPERRRQDLDLQRDQPGVPAAGGRHPVEGRVDHGQAARQGRRGSASPAPSRTSSCSGR